MRISTDVSPVIDVEQYHINAISFQDTHQANEFISRINEYGKSKQEDSEIYFHFIDDDLNIINQSKFNPIVLNCGDINVLKDKSVSDSILKTFENRIHNDHNIYQLYENFRIEMDKLISNLIIKDSLYNIELDDHNIKVKKMLKLFDIDIHYNFDNLNSIQTRKAFIDLQIDKSKENIIFLFYPEAHLGVSDIVSFMNIIKDYGFTTIVVTNHVRIVLEASKIALCKKNQELYNFENLTREYKSFYDRIANDKILKLIAWHEFTGDYLLKNEEYINFINEY